MTMISRLISGPLVLASLVAPIAAEFDEGEMYVTDFQNSEIYLVDAGGTWAVTQLPASTWPVNRPGEIEFTFGGQLLVSDFANNTLIEFDGSGSASTALTSFDGIDGPYGAGGIAIGPGAGHVFVTNLGSGEVLEFDADYGNKTVFADAGDGLVSPTAIAFLHDGDALVADRNTNQVVHLDSATGMSTVFDIFPHTPVDLAVRDNQDVYVLDIRGFIFRYAAQAPGVQVFLGVYGNGNGAITFSPDHSVLYHTNPGDSAIRTIDPDTGVDTVVATIPGKPTGMAVAGSQYAPGSYIEFGVPLVGTGGFAPALHGIGEPRIGQTSQFVLEDFLGGAPIWLFVSLGVGEFPVLGGVLHPNLIDPAFWLIFPGGGAPGLAGEGGLNLNFSLPDTSFLVGLRMYIQALGIDPGGVMGASLTNCLTMYIGA